MHSFALMFPVVFIMLLMVTFRGFGRNVLKWLWDQKFVLAIAIAAAATAIEMIGLSAITKALPVVAQLAFQLLFAVMFMVVQFGAMMWIMSRPRVTWYQPGELNLTYEDYVGNPVVLQLLKESIENIRSNTQFAAMGGKPSRGILLSGPPGTGKSYGGRLVASVCKVPFCLVDAASLQSAFMGMGSMTVNSLYSQARKYATKYGACIIFLDELDAIGGARIKQGAGTGMMGGMMMGGGSQLLNTLLTNLDPPPADQTWRSKMLRRLGFPTAPATTPYVLTMGATNLPESLDAALTRDGRMDLKIHVDLPDVDGRMALFAHELKKIRTADELDVGSVPIWSAKFDGNDNNYLTDTVRANIRHLALQTSGWSPAEIKTVVTNKAVAEAARTGQTVVRMQDVVAARRTKSYNVKQPLLSMSIEEKRRIGYHEGGHAFMAIAAAGDERIVEYATVIRRGNALGMVAWASKGERYNQTKAELISYIDICLASRAVEIECLGDDQSQNGFSGDLAQATTAAINMIGRFGMDDELVSLEALGVPVSKAKINRLLQKRMALVRAIVRNYKPVVVALSELIIAKEEVDGDELYACFYSMLPVGIVIEEAILATSREIESEYLAGRRQNDEFAENSANDMKS
ncbi:AAA family ATPase [soil metagenome]